VNDATDLAARIEDIERGYEYLLAYAAQGRQQDAGSEARQTLERMSGALTGFDAVLRAVLAEDAAAGGVPAYVDAACHDAAVARGAIDLVLGRAVIPSLLVDNLNASVHLRALLTDVFLIEQALKVPAAPAG
jgi:hypothetical protein